MILFSTRMSSSGRLRSWSAWAYAENKPLQVLGVPLVPPRCGIWVRQHHFIHHAFSFLSWWYQKGVNLVLAPSPVQGKSQPLRALCFPLSRYRPNQRPQFLRSSETVQDLHTPIGQRIAALCFGFVGPLGGSSLLALFPSSLPRSPTLLQVHPIRPGLGACPLRPSPLLLPRCFSKRASRIAIGV